MKGEGERVSLGGQGLLPELVTISVNGMALRKGT
jgi:hypothetical protein